MKIDKIIETEEGTVRFQGEIEGLELDLVLKVGLNYLLKVGVLNTAKPIETPDGEAVVQ